MEQNRSQPLIHLILPKVGDQEYHFCLKTPEEFTKAAQALFERQSIVCKHPLKTVDDAKNYLLDNYREHHSASDALDFGSPTVREGGRQKYNGPTLRDHIKSQGLLEQFGLN
jgi:hypothetical protein